MNKFFKTLSLLAAIAFFSTACSAKVVQAQPAEALSPKAGTYQALLGKAVNAKDVSDFITSNNCTPSGQFQFCWSTGLVLWADNSQIIKTVYLSLDGSDGFAAYEGELPLGLLANDTRASVEKKLGEPGLPREGSSPDHVHFWEVYRRFGMTIVYNSPSREDKGATIHALLINSNCSFC